MLLQPTPVGCGLGQAKAPLAPQDASQFLDEMLLRRSLGCVLGHKRGNEGAVFVGVLPGQYRVARQDAVLQRVEAGDVSATGLSRQVRLDVGHDQKVLFRLGLSLRASRRSDAARKGLVGERLGLERLLA